MKSAIVRVVLVIVSTIVAGCARHDDQPAALGRASQRLTTQRELSLDLPRNVSLFDVALASMSSLAVGSEAIVSKPSGFATVANSGPSETDVGVDARIGTVVSEGHPRLRNRALVTGDLITASSSVTLANGAAITGTTTTSALLAPPQPFSWTIDFATSSTDVFVAAGTDQTLSPGAYHDVRVDTGGTLRLSAGTYDLNALRTAPGSHLVVEANTGPTFVYVDTTLDTKAPFDAQGLEARVFVGYLGVGNVSIASPFAGTVVAPKATLRLDPGLGEYRGSFFAESIVVGPRAQVVYETFAAWDFIFPPRPFVDCVERFDATHANAYWGYENPLAIPVTIPVGSRNQFSPAIAETPITLFDPGRHEKVLKTSSPRPSLRGRLATRPRSRAHSRRDTAPSRIALRRVRPIPLTSSALVRAPESRSLICSRSGVRSTSRVVRACHSQIR